MKKKFIQLVLFTALLPALSSCDQAIFNQIQKELTATSMTFDYHEVTLMLGDSCQVSMIFNPDSVTTTAALWEVRDPDNVVAITRSGTFVATQTGNTYVVGTLTSNQLSDSCLVHVIPNWAYFEPNDYEYDMMMLANVNIKGELNNPNIMIGAYVDGKICGVGQVVTYHDITFTLLRIYSKFASDENVTFYSYDPKHYKLEKFNYETTFDGETHGTLTHLIPLTIE